MVVRSCELLSLAANPSHPMLKQIKSLVRKILPYGVVDSHQRGFMLGRLGLPNTRETAAAVDGCRYNLWPSFLRADAPPWTLVDVGANDGGFLSSAFQLVSPREVFVFEPLPACQASLQALLSKHSNAHLFPCAVGSAKGELELHCTGDSKMSSALEPAAHIEGLYQSGNFKVVRKVTVPVVRLDDVLPDELPVDLLKIDVQGFELEVFKGAERTLKRTRSVLLEVNYVEHYKGGAGFGNVYDVMRGHGFKIYGVSAPYGGGKGGPLWADAMFVKEEA